MRVWWVGGTWAPPPRLPCLQLSAAFQMKRTPLRLLGQGPDMLPNAAPGPLPLAPACATSGFENLGATCYVNATLQVRGRPGLRVDGVVGGW